MRRKWFIMALPILGALLLAGLLWSGLINNPIISIRADIGMWMVIVGAGGSLLLLIIIMVQRRQQMIRQEAYNQAAADHRRFLARLDHELKNPLTAIRSSLTNLTDPEANELRPQAIESINTQAIRLTRLVFDLRKLADLETQPIEQHTVNLTELLQETVEIAREHPQAEGIQISLSLPKPPWPLPTIIGDHDLIFIAIHNLLDNAVKYSKPGDGIEVRGYEDGQTVVIEVADAGAGIPEHDVPHVWDELYRGGSALSVTGSGLGLALVRAIVRRHGGQATLRSKLGTGTVVTIRLPVSPSATRSRRL